jgi:8-oxo-dGTP diphosphatase
MRGVSSTSIDVVAPAARARDALAPPRRILVVAGLVADGGRVLVTQRRADQSHPLGWEFPGGKIEPGEAPEIALRRELREEIDVEVEVGPVWDVLHHCTAELEVVMLVYPCRLRPGSVPRPVEVADLAWWPATGLAAVAILPADEPLVRRLELDGLPPFLR